MRVAAVALGMLCVTAAMSTTVAPNANTPTHVAELTMLVQLAVGNEQRAPHRGLQDNSVILTDGNYRDAVEACLAESGDGNCPLYGLPQDWDTSTLTTMSNSACGSPACPPPLQSSTPPMHSASVKGSRCAAAEAQSCAN